MAALSDDFERAAQVFTICHHLPPTQILAAAQEVHRGGSPMSSQMARLLVQKFQETNPKIESAASLTSREAEVLEFAAKGNRSKKIADALALNPRTAQTHFQDIYEKLHMESREGGGEISAPMTVTLSQTLGLELLVVGFDQHR